MSLTIKQLNPDASFLVSFEPALSGPPGTSTPRPLPFTILLDPWVTGPSKIFHPKFSISTFRYPPCIDSLAKLAQPPDLVIISQAKSDHCNQETLRQLPSTGTKTLILAEPASSRLIRSWKYFGADKVRTIGPHGSGSRKSSGGSTIVRIPVPPLLLGLEKGEVTVAWIPQKRDLAGLHGAIGITYRQPSACMAPDTVQAPRPISIIFSPHGLSYRDLEPYVTSHLVPEGALPLTALLHCMDIIDNPWWLGGNICAGGSTGAQIATKLQARVWVSAHDGDKEVKGLATKLLKVRRFGWEELEGVVREGWNSSEVQKMGRNTEILRLNVGEEVVVDADGVRMMATTIKDDISDDKQKRDGIAVTSTKLELKRDGVVVLSENTSHASTPPLSVTEVKRISLIEVQEVLSRGIS